MPLNLETLRSYVRRHLGDGIVRVELTTEQIDTAIQDAVDLVNHYVPPHRWAQLPEGTSTGVVEIREADAPGIQDVIDVVAIRQNAVVGDNRLDLFDPLLYISGGAVQGGQMASYRLAVESLKEYRRLFSSEVEWRGYWDFDAAITEQQTVTIGAGTTAFALKFETPKTVDITVGTTTPAQVETSLEALFNIGNVTVTTDNVNGVASPIQEGDTLTVEFVGSCTAGDVVLLEAVDDTGQSGTYTNVTIAESRKGVPAGRVYRLFINIPETTRMVYGYEYIMHVTADDDERTGLLFSPPGMDDWMRKYTVARCKMILGRALSKFQGIPSPEGSDLQLDGELLKSDAENEHADLLDQIQGYRQNLPLIVG